MPRPALSPGDFRFGPAMPETAPLASPDDFRKLDIRVGVIREARPLEGARKPAYALRIDLGPEFGERPSSAQITELYEPAELVGRRVLCVVNFPPMRITGFCSEVLTLGVYTEAGVSLIAPDERGGPKPGDRLG